MRIYTAARYSRRLELVGYRDQLRALGHDVQARWLDGSHQIYGAGKPLGEDGEALVEDHDNDARNAALRAKFAQDDWEDVTAADLVIAFTEPPRSSAGRGGRHIETGIALGRGIRVWAVGYRENLFFWLPQVRFFAMWQEALSALTVKALYPDVR